MSTPSTIVKTKLNYRGFWNCDSTCELEILRAGEKYTVILSELEENQGTSVTNMYE